MIEITSAYVMRHVVDEHAHGLEAGGALLQLQLGVVELLGATLAQRLQAADLLRLLLRQRARTCRRQHVTPPRQGCVRPD